MTRLEKVLWSEGLFLTPQHFQQWDRYFEEFVSFRLRSLTTFSWGAEELEFNADALQNGMVELVRCKAVLPDGVPLSIPETDPAPPSRSFVQDFAPSSDRLSVHLAVPVVRAAGANLSGNGDGAAPDSMTRFRMTSASVLDENTGENPQPVSLATKNLRLLVGEDVSGHVSLKVAELRRTQDGKVVLDDLFVPPATALTASKYLLDIVRRLYEVLTAKSVTLSDQRRQKGPGIADFTTSDVANFWLLHTVNSYLPVMMHFHHVQKIHPEQLYIAMARLAAELTTFVTDANPGDLPRYYHSDLTRTFTELDRRLRVLLETVIPTRCVPIPLERTKESLYVGRILDDRLLTQAEFFLGVYARMPEAQIIERVPRKTKIASLDTINYLLGQALPGVLLRPVPIPPGPIPARMGFKYFRLEKLGTYWDTISAARSVCIYFPAEFPELRLELYAVKD
jgi:type VI secretion system protein ImpJ